LRRSDVSKATRRGGLGAQYVARDRAEGPIARACVAARIWRASCATSAAAGSATPTGTGHTTGVSTVIASRATRSGRATGASGVRTAWAAVASASRSATGASGVSAARSTIVHTTCSGSASRAGTANATCRSASGSERTAAATTGADDSAPAAGEASSTRDYPSGAHEPSGSGEGATSADENAASAVYVIAESVVRTTSRNGDEGNRRNEQGPEEKVGSALHVTESRSFPREFGAAIEPISRCNGIEDKPDFDRSGVEMSASNKNFATCPVADFARARRAAKTSREPRGPAARLAWALEWQRQLDAGEVASRAEIARREGISRARVTQIMQALKQMRVAVRRTSFSR
jgi:hypothetical protein